MRIVQPDRPIFIYQLRQPADMAVRYIGQSVDPVRRLIGHLCEARSGAQSYRSNWLRKLLAEGSQPILEIIEETTVEAWIERETYWIAFYRAEGCRLVNATDGGEGALGFIPSEETRAKMSAARKGKTRNPESVRKMVETQRGRKMPLEIVERRYEHYLVSDPRGEQSEINGLAPFCRRHGLDAFCFENVLNGRARHHRGWQLRRIGDPTPFFPLDVLKGLPYIVTNPQGEPSLVMNVTRWCEERGVNRHDLQWSLKRKTAMAGWQMCRAVWMEGGWQIPEDWERWPEFVPDYSYTPERRARLSERLSGERNPFHGRQHSEESKAKQRAAKLGKPSLKKGRPAPENQEYHRKPYLVTSPGGEEITVTNLAKFCEEHGLTRSNMVSVASGKWHQHKGWKCRRLEDIPAEPLPMQLRLPLSEEEPIS